jgi:hypothetical protein
VSAAAAPAAPAPVFECRTKRVTVSHRVASDARRFGVRRLDGGSGSGSVRCDSGPAGGPAAAAATQCSRGRGAARTLCALANRVRALVTLVLVLRPLLVQLETRIFFVFTESGSAGPGLRVGGATPSRRTA